MKRIGWWFWVVQALYLTLFAVPPSGDMGIWAGLLNIGMVGCFAFIYYIYLFMQLRHISALRTLSYLVFSVIFGIEFFSTVFYTLYSFNPHAVHIDVPRTGYPFIYYSVTTFTTTGYGDLYPLSALARSFAALEMLSGWATSTLVMALVSSKIFLRIQNTDLPRNQ
jgi:hypothetical protein